MKWRITNPLRFRLFTEKSSSFNSQRCCPRCCKPVEETYIYCPECHEVLKYNCPSCSRIVQTDWKVCPYCEVKLEPKICPEER